MNNDFFSSLEQRTKDFAGRTQVGDHVKIEVVLTSGRTYVLQAVVEATEAWLQFDGHEASVEDVPVSLSLPYHQISHVIFSKQKARGTAGFSR